MRPLCLKGLIRTHGNSNGLGHITKLTYFELTVICCDTIGQFWVKSLLCEEVMCCLLCAFVLKISLVNIWCNKFAFFVCKCSLNHLNSSSTWLFGSKIFTITIRTQRQDALQSILNLHLSTTLFLCGLSFESV